jgi:hypothetical protein
MPYLISEAIALNAATLIYVLKKVLCPRVHHVLTQLIALPAFEHG